MYIRRDHRDSFFRERRRRRWPRVLALALVLIAGAWFLSTRPELIATAAYNILNAQATPTPLASTLATQATQRYQLGDLEGAAQLLERAVNQRPENLDYLYEYGQIMIDRDQPEPVLELARRMIAIDAEDVRGFTLRARALVWQGDNQSAIPVGVAGLDLDPAFGPLHAALARAYTNSQRWQDGLRHGDLAVQYAPGDVRAYWAYANSLTAVGAYSEAVRALEDAIEIHPAFLPPYFELAFLYLSSNRDRDAIATYDRILSMQPSHARALLRQCEAYRKVGEFQRAQGFCEDAVVADPSFVPAQYRLGLLRYNERRFEDARVAFQTCRDNDPGNLECTYRLGLTYYYLDNCGVAWDLLQDGLLMAQTQDAPTSTVDIIREGLIAISTDDKCPDYADLFQPTPTPTLTPDPASAGEQAPASDAADESNGG